MTGAPYFRAVPEAGDLYRTEILGEDREWPAVMTLQNEAGRMYLACLEPGGWMPRQAEWRIVPIRDGQYKALAEERVPDPDPFRTGPVIRMRLSTVTWGWEGNVLEPEDFHPGDPWPYILERIRSRRRWIADSAVWGEANGWRVMYSPESMDLDFRRIRSPEPGVG